MNDSQERALGPSSELRTLVRLAVPMAAQQVGFQLMGTVDSAMLGHYSDAALAGAGVGNNLIFGITSIGFGLVMGLDTVVPQALGAGRRDDARRALDAGIRLAILVGLVATLVIFATPLLLDAASVDPAVIHEARAYIYVRAIGTAPFLVTIALRSYLAAHHRTRPLLVAVIAGNLVNAALDLALIFGVPALGIPPLGVIGAAIATTSVLIVTVAVYLSAVRRLDGRDLRPAGSAAEGRRGSIDGGEPRPKSTRADMHEIVHHGWPVGAQIFAEVGIFGVATVIAAHFGEIPAAAHAIALGFVSLTFSFAFGLAAATSVQVGHATGAGDLVLARRRGLLGLYLSFAVMASCALVIAIAPAAIAHVFSNRAEVITATVPLLLIAALFQLFDGAQSVAAGALRGLGHTRETLYGNLIGHYAIGFPLSLALAFGAGLVTPGLWWGLSAGLVVTSAYLVTQFLRNTSRSPR